MRIIKKETVVRFRMVVIALNCLLASMSLINLYTVASGAIKVQIPDENDFAWTIDTKQEEASFIADFMVENKGVYDISDLDIHAIVRTEKGNMLIDYRQEDLRIPSGEEKRFNILAVMPFERIDMNEWKTLLLNDSVFYLDVDITANYLWGLGKFVVDDTLEYPWEAPFGKIENETDEQAIELIKYVVSENVDIDGLVDSIADNIVNNSFIGKFNWDDASLRVESWPMGDNTSRIIMTFNLDLFSGRRSMTFEISFFLKMEGEKYEFTFEDFNFNYR
ncbi:MAG: hypothetical protein JSV56_02400 [Methanomassiliicoccales archaeon]|nr:MAG: hypothetical protein JSV56_02400 [Methanomassiliicoccales archaeon]